MNRTNLKLKPMALHVYVPIPTSDYPRPWHVPYLEFHCMGICRSRRYEFEARKRGLVVEFCLN